LPGRFKRIYVDKEHGVPFFGGKQLLSLNPTNVKHLSLTHHGDRIESQLLLEENMCLVTRSGTIGKTMIAPKHWNGWVANEHCLRIKPANESVAGYIYAWLDSPYAKPLIVRNTYGAVVDEIDDNQLSTVAIPLLKNNDIQQKINNLVLEANELRHQAYLKEQEAINKMNEILTL
jgi:type I restriction enzyme S subunit